MNDKIKPFDNRTIGKFQELVNINAELTAVFKQLEQTKVTKKDVQDLMHDLKSGKLSQVYPVRGGTLVTIYRSASDNKKEMMKLLSDRLVSFDTIEKGLQEGITMRQDQLVEAFRKIYELLVGHFEYWGLSDLDYYVKNPKKATTRDFTETPTLLKTQEQLKKELEELKKV